MHSINILLVFECTILLVCVFTNSHHQVLLEEDLVEVEAELCNAETCTFEELNLSDYDSDLDADYSPSEESSSEDELEFNTDAEVSSVVDDLELLA